MKNIDDYTKREMNDLNWFIPRYRNVLKRLGGTLSRYQTTRDKYGDPYHTWDVEVDVCINGYDYHTVVELKDRGSDGYRFADFLKGGRCGDGLIMDRQKCIDWYTKKGAPRGLYVWLFPKDNIMVTANWMEALKASKCMDRAVNANTVRSTSDKVAKWNYFLELKTVPYINVYKFDEQMNVERLDIDKLNDEIQTLKQ